MFNEYVLLLNYNATNGMATYSRISARVSSSESGILTKKPMDFIMWINSNVTQNLVTLNIETRL